MSKNPLSSWQLRKQLYTGHVARSTRRTEQFYSQSGWQRCVHGRLQIAQVNEPSFDRIYHAICHRITQGRAFLYTACHIYAMFPNEPSIGKQSRIYASKERGQRPTLQKLETTRHTLTNKSPGTTAEDRTAPYYRTAQTEE